MFNLDNLTTDDAKETIFKIKVSDEGDKLIEKIKRITWIGLLKEVKWIKAELLENLNKSMPGRNKVTLDEKLDVINLITLIIAHRNITK